MRILAYIERLDINSRVDPVEPILYCGHGTAQRAGPWKVDRESFFGINKTLEDSVYTTVATELNTAFNNPNFWTDFGGYTGLSLDKPLYSLVAARIILITSSIWTGRTDMCNVENTPTASSSDMQMANFSYRCYRRGIGNETESLSLFKTRVKMVRLQDENSKYLQSTLCLLFILH